MKFRKKLLFNKGNSIKYLYVSVFITFIIVFVISALLSLYAPYSARSTARFELSPIYSDLQERVVEVYAKDKQRVIVGQPLFKLDDFKLKEKLFDLENKYSNQVNKLESLDKNILIAKEKIEQEKKIVANNKIEYNRYKISYKNHSISQEKFQEKELNYKTSLNQLNISKLNLESQINNRGIVGKYNESLQSIVAQENQIKKDIFNSVVKSKSEGTLSLHDLSVGQMINKNNSFGYIYKKSDIYVYVDYMEKSMVKMRKNNEALVLFDAIPGKLFKAHVEETATLLSSGYNGPNQMENIAQISRWIRPTGRARVKIVLDEKLPKDANVTSGSRSSVTVFSENHHVLNFIALLWMRIASLINYIY